MKYILCWIKWIFSDSVNIIYSLYQLVEETFHFAYVLDKENCIQSVTLSGENAN